MKASTPLLLVIATLLIQVSSGINYVTLPVILDGQGYSNMLIGVAMSFEILGVVLLYKQLSDLLQRLGFMQTLVLLSILRSVSLVLLANNTSYPLWLLGIFCYGVSTGMLLVLVQTWLNIIVEGKSKGLMMGLFSSALSSGVALGPILLQFIDISLTQRIHLNSALMVIPMVLLALLLLMSKERKVFEVAGSVRVGFAFRHGKTIMIAALIGGISFFGLPNFLTLYGVKSGLSAEQAPLLMTTFMLGSVFLGMMLSTVSMYFDRQRVVLCCVFTSVVCAVFLSLSVYSNYFVALGLLFVWGGTMGAIYAIGLSVIGERFHHEEQISVNMSYNLMDSIGGIIGLLVIGLSMDFLGEEGMVYVLVSSGCLFLVFFVRQMIVGNEEFK